MQYLTIEVPVWMWQRVDGCTDNSMAIDAVDAITETLLVGACVRDAGWRAAAAYQGEHDQFGWPPRAYPLPVTLRRSHWEWVLSQLKRWEPYESDGVLPEVRRCISAAIEPA
ncbi:hypothetical protein [Sinomonas albida]|uniref:hypothetical protein n=1 Tax=Sinomonas albida TaxID=369942 RepID=UPI003016E0F3